MIKNGSSSKSARFGRGLLRRKSVETPYRNKSNPSIPIVPWAKK